MVVLDEYKFKLGELSKTLEQANAQMRPEELKTELNGLEEQMSAADFWNDVDAANKVTQRVKSIKDKLDRLNKLNGNIHVRRIQVEMGAQINGTCNMISEEDYDTFVKDVITTEAPEVE
ncbi:MAG: hypothetical protein II959_02075 [Clostridia bacterium]|nr:hypothetical protein [Clostridia bacterium]